MSKHIHKGIAITLIVMLLTVFTAVPAMAFDVRSGDTVTVPSGEAVDGPLFVAAAQTITIDGTVNGGLWAASRTINVNGTVNGSVIAIGQTINISGVVGGNVIVGCLNLNITNTATIKGSILFAAGIAQINGAVQGGSNILPILPLSNEVKENVALQLGISTILPMAGIPGDLSYTDGQESNVQSGAQFLGKTADASPPAEHGSAIFGSFLPFLGALGWLIYFLIALVTGLTIILIAPRRLTSIADSIRTCPGRCAGWGAIVLIVTPIAAIIVGLTIVGIAVGVITMALYAIALYLAQIPVSLLIGKLIIGRSRPLEGKGIMIGALAVGLAIITLLELIPYFGIFIGLAVIIFGLGAAVISEKQRRAAAHVVASSE